MLAVLQDLGLTMDNQQQSNNVIAMARRDSESRYARDDRQQWRKDVWEQQ